MLPFYYFVASTFAFSDYNNTYFLNMDIYILILITYMFIKYKYSHFYITRVSAVFYLHPVYIALVLVF